LNPFAPKTNTHNTTVKSCCVEVDGNDNATFKYTSLALPAIFQLYHVYSR